MSHSFSFFKDNCHKQRLVRGRNITHAHVFHVGPFWGGSGTTSIRAAQRIALPKVFPPHHHASGGAPGTARHLARAATCEQLDFLCRKRPLQGLEHLKAIAAARALSPPPQATPSCGPAAGAALEALPVRPCRSAGAPRSQVVCGAACPRPQSAVDAATQSTRAAWAPRARAGAGATPGTCACAAAGARGPGVDDDPDVTGMA